MAIAVSFSQYWNAWTNVMDRIPPPTTFAITMAATTTGPIQNGSPRRIFRVRPAPWYCGTRYSTQITTTKSIVAVRSRGEASRNSVKSGTV